MSPKKENIWVSRGIISACECFSCENKLDHRFRDGRVLILCKDPCNYKPLSGVEKSEAYKIEDIEHLKNSELISEDRRVIKNPQKIK